MRKILMLLNVLRTKNRYEFFLIGMQLLKEHNESKFKKPKYTIILTNRKTISAECWMAVRAHIFAVPTQRASLFYVYIIL